MKQVTIVLEFDESVLGDQWMNIANLSALLYSGTFTNSGLLKVVSYTEPCHHLWRGKGNDYTCVNCGVKATLYLSAVEEKE